MPVGRDDLEAHLARLAAQVRDPRAGIYGPDSLSWEINRESVIMLGGGAASLLQLAHPFVAHAIDQHSATRSDPLGRFQRTFSNVFAMVFGDLSHALESARRVHDVHRKIRGRLREQVGQFTRGQGYDALDEQALLWVHAILVDTALRVYEPVVRPLSSVERERYYQESKLFAYLFGLGDDVLPADWPAFSAYYQRTIASDAIAVGEPARQMSAFLLKPPTRLHAPLSAWFAELTAGLLPPKLRTQYGFAWSAGHARKHERSLALLHAAYRRVPERFRFFPAYVEATRRLAGKREHDRWGRLLERVALRSIQPARGAAAQP